MASVEHRVRYERISDRQVMKFFIDASAVLLDKEATEKALDKAFTKAKKELFDGKTS